MKKWYLILFLLGFTLASCDNDDISPSPGPVMQPNPVPDNETPKATIKAPLANSVYVVIDRVDIQVLVEDNIGIRQVRFYLASPGASDTLQKLADFLIDRNSKTLELYDSFRLPKTATMGTFKIIVEAKDKSGLVVKDSVAFTIHAPDLKIDVFRKTFLNVDLFSILDWSGYVFDSVNGLEEEVFHVWLEMIVNRNWDLTISEAEWNKFMADFNLINHSFSDWDENDDENISSMEFNKAMSSLALFKSWDLNKDGRIKLEEVAEGFFNSWDNNRDGTLTKAEYLERFYTYCLFMD